jgi:hypothetical protein
MPPGLVGPFQVGGPVGELDLGAAVVDRAPDRGAGLAAVGELVPDVVGRGEAGEQRAVRPGDEVGQRRRAVGAAERRLGAEGAEALAEDDQPGAVPGRELGPAPVDVAVQGDAGLGRLVPVDQEGTAGSRGRPGG